MAPNLHLGEVKTAKWENRYNKVEWRKPKQLKLKINKQVTLISDLKQATESKKKKRLKHQQEETNQ